MNIEYSINECMSVSYETWDVANTHKSLITEAATGGVSYVRKGVLKNSAEFTRKHLCLSLFFLDSGKGVFL